jgi:hypothetical protein
LGKGLISQSAIGNSRPTSTVPVACCAFAAGVIFAASGKGFWSAKPVDNEVRDMLHAAQAPLALCSLCHRFHHCLTVRLMHATVSFFVGLGL